MNITKKTEENAVTLLIEGRLDTQTSTKLSDELDTFFESGAVDLILDFSKLEYISSAGLRVLLVAQKKAKSAGTGMKILGSSDTVKEIFDVTGFSTILDIR